jgi:hypothetical protein
VATSVEYAEVQEGEKPMIGWICWSDIARTWRRRGKRRRRRRIVVERGRCEGIVADRGERCV